MITEMITEMLLPCPMLLDFHFNFSMGTHADWKVDLGATTKLQISDALAPKAERMSLLHMDVSRTSPRRPHAKLLFHRLDPPSLAAVVYHFTHQK
jgi:hypothetical protein